jgi:hypothetical protein
MTTQRSRAYAHVLALLEAPDAAELHPEEHAAVRDAADALLFTTEPVLGREARAALDVLDDIADRLVMFDRMEPDTVERLLLGVSACGPQAVAASAYGASHPIVST